MAQRGVELDRETFSCSICLDLLNDPVTIPCGHSYCMVCIQGYWGGEAEGKVDSCPQCRQTITPRPVLVKNTMLAALAEQMKKTGLQNWTPPEPCHAGPEDISCDICTGRKLKARKSCFDCLVSYCEKHLQPHYSVAPLKKHKLVEPCNSLQENICPRHDEVVKMFCRTDQQSICYLCSVDEHKGHETVSAAAERTERQKEVKETQKEIQQRIQDQEKDVKLLQQEERAINSSADSSVVAGEIMLDDLIHVIQSRFSEVKQQIRSQQEAEVRRVQELEEKVKQEISELQRRDAELEHLIHIQDHNRFLHNYCSASQLGKSAASSGIHVRPLSYFEEVTAAVSELRDKVQDVLGDHCAKILLAVVDVDVLLSEPEPKTRADFLKYSCDITLDSNTAHKNLVLSNGNRKVTFVKDTDCLDHPDRFKRVTQVLSRESLTGRCYWEVERSESGNIFAAVSYKNISRAGGFKQCGFGFNDQSWALSYNSSGFIFWNKSIKTKVSAPVSTRIGMYLNHTAGILSFYSVSDTMTLIHTVQTTFTQPLHAGLWLDGNTHAEFCKL